MSKKKYDELAAALGVKVETLRVNAPKGYSAFVLDPANARELDRFVRGEGYADGDTYAVHNYMHRGAKPELLIRRLPSGGLLFEINPEGR